MRGISPPPTRQRQRPAEGFYILYSEGASRQRPAPELGGEGRAKRGRVSPRRVHLSPSFPVPPFLCSCHQAQPVLKRIHLAASIEYPLANRYLAARYTPSVLAICFARSILVIILPFLLLRGRIHSPPRLVTDYFDSSAKSSSRLGASALAAFAFARAACNSLILALIAGCFRSTAICSSVAFPTASAAASSSTPCSSAMAVTRSAVELPARELQTSCMRLSTTPCIAPKAP